MITTINEFRKILESFNEPIGTKKNGFIKTGANSWQHDPDMIKKIEPRKKDNRPGFWHGSTDKNMNGEKGIHIGTFEAAKQALQARIGVKADGDWDGTSEYGKTLIAGKKSLKRMGPYLETGYNCGNDVPEEDYYPVDRNKKAKYSDGTEIPMDCKPIIFQVYITGKMSNSVNTPHEDNRANSMMLRNLKMGNAKNGYYYINDGEDSGSISAVVPNKSFLQIL